MRVFAIGDSITFGHSDREALGWVGRLPNPEGGIQYYNLGVCGDTTSQILARAFHEINVRKVTHHDNLILLGASLNDLCLDEDDILRTNVETLQAQMIELIGVLQNLAPTFVIGPFPVDEGFNPYFFHALEKDMYYKNAIIMAADNIYAQICKTHNAPYLSMYTVLKEDPSYRHSLKSSDGLHPCEIGYQRAADYIASWKEFRSYLRIPEKETI